MFIPARRHFNAFAFIFFNAAFFYYWYAFPLANTQFLDGIPKIGSSNLYVSARYGWLWWSYWALALNQLLPLSLAWALANADVEEWTRVHAWLSRNAKLLNLFVFVVLSIFWLLFCNTPFSDGSTPCNNYRWCCVFTGSAWCPNSAPCTPGATYGDLVMNSEAKQNWAFSLVFLLFSTWNEWMNQSLREFRVLN